jgi:hypothetical protein
MVDLWISRGKLRKPILRARDRLQCPINIIIKGGNIKNASVKAHVAVVVRLTVRERMMYTLLP